MDLSLIYKSYDLKEVFTFNHYQSLFSNETYYSWNQLWQIVDYTKAYRFGVEIALTLLEKFDLYKDNFTDQEKDGQLKSIYLMLLKMYDKADMWEDYLRNWEVVKQRSIELNLVSNCTELTHKNLLNLGGEEVLLNESSHGYTYVFLAGQINRKKIIERKLAKAKKGGLIKNNLHMQQSDFSQEEITERYDFILEYLAKGDSDISSPASRQWEERIKAKKNNIKL